MVGQVEAIFIAATQGAPVEALAEVEAVARRGLTGDRNFFDEDDGHDPADEITLIAAEGLEQGRADHGLELAPGEHRRQVVIAGVDLLALVGATVRIGEVEVAVVADNPGCRYLQTLVGKPVLRGLRRHGGVRGGIVRGGVLRVGDPVAG